MSIGYTHRIASRNKQANGHMLGVKLGRQCIKHDVSVIDLAKHFKVSRQCIYNWFTGATVPHDKYRQNIEGYLIVLKAE